MSITKFPGHMRSIKLNFSATASTLDLKAKIFENFARAPRLTAVLWDPSSSPLRSH